MNGFNWEFDFDPTFPIYVYHMTVDGNRDPMHWHQYFEIGLCIEGSGKFIFMNKEYSVKKGDVFLANNFENHVAISENGEKTEYIFVFFMPSLIADPNGKQLDLQFLLPFQYHPLDFANKVSRDTPAAKKIYFLIQEIYDFYRKENAGPFDRLEIDIRLRQVLLELLNHYWGNGDFKTGDSIMNLSVQKAIKYMNLHFGENITIAQVADHIGINSSYFRHLFKEHTQITFKTYLTYLRISQAKKLLLATDKSINDIILEVGYNNAYQFYEVFKNLVKMSPAEYRRQYRNKIDHEGNWQAVI